MPFSQFVIKNTRRYGKGVFAGRAFASGDVIHVLSGDTMGIAEFIRRVNGSSEGIDDPLQVGKRTYIDLDEFSRTFNHSCDPSAGLRKRSELFALRDIRTGEEITYDYSLTIAPTDWKMRCACRSPSCRTMIGDILSVPRVQRMKYRKRGAMQTYMRHIVDMIESGHPYMVPAYEKRLLAGLSRTSNVDV